MSILKGKPKEPGYYWYYDSLAYGWDIAEIYNGSNGKLMVRFSAHNCSLDSVESRILWSEQIPKPPLPETEEMG